MTTGKRTRYEKYLRTGHWRRFRKHAARHLEQRCPCGARSNLQLHHMTYERLGKERLEDVAWLCGNCHQKLHDTDPNGGMFAKEGG